LSNRARPILQVRLGFSSEKGERPDNQDYVAAHFGRGDADATRGIVAAIADGVGGHKGGRQAAETTVRAFMDGYYAMPETLGVRRSASRSLDAINRWIHAQGRVDPELAGMGCTFSCLILAGRSAHVVHAGDSRIYRLGEGGLERLTEDHVLGRGDLSHILRRAVGFEETVKSDHLALAPRVHDRFLLCTDGVHGVLADARLKSLLDDGATPEECASRIVAAALAAGSSDNATALVLDVVELPLPDQRGLVEAMADLPMPPAPAPGDVVDGFILGEALSHGHYSQLFHARDGASPRPLALKFPHPRAASEAAFRLAFVREAWVGARVRGQWIGEILELPPGRQSRLYSVMPFYEGQTLEARSRESRMTLGAAIPVAVMLARAVDSLHRAGVIHRDIKPDNVILTPDGGLKLIDLGVARVPELEDFPASQIPGTPSYMAPEMLEGESIGDEATDLYALGVTVYRMFTRGYPYGEIDPYMTPRFTKYAPISRARPDLPAWLDVVLAKAVHPDPARRFGDALEFAYELEQGAASGRFRVEAKRSLHERDPVRLWQLISAGLLIIIAALLLRDFHGTLR
jgi:serine/threonine protein phosphatase PrpC